MIIEGIMYTSDLIIYPDRRVTDSWWRKSGHRLCLDDIDGLIRSGPQVIIAGTGVNGLMKPEKDLEQLLDQKGIRFIAEPTPKAAETYNNLLSKTQVGACFHLTC
jgi:hypothetical protein